MYICTYINIYIALSHTSPTICQITVASTVQIRNVTVMGDNSLVCPCMALWFPTDEKSHVTLRISSFPYNVRCKRLLAVPMNKMIPQEHHWGSSENWFPHSWHAVHIQRLEALIACNRKEHKFETMKPCTFGKKEKKPIVEISSLQKIFPSKNEYINEWMNDYMNENIIIFHRNIWINQIKAMQCIWLRLYIWTKTTLLSPMGWSQYRSFTKFIPLTGQVKWMFTSTTAPLDVVVGTWKNALYEEE